MKNLKNKWITILIGPVLFIFGMVYVINGSDLALGLFCLFGVVAFVNSFNRIMLKDLIINKEDTKAGMPTASGGKKTKTGGGKGPKEDKSPR